MLSKATHLGIVILMILALFSCRSRKDFIERQASKSYKAEYIPKKHEMRAAWLPTVFRSEYAQMTPEQMKADFVRKLDQLQSIGFNTIIFQIRPESDAWYRSDLEPWSRFLTGVQGRAPQPEWDPMAFLIEECHKRCMEFHAWINPYRAATGANNQLSYLHPYHRHPTWFLKYNNQLLYNPGLEECREYICLVVGDIVRRYDIDAIHMDDYFYPYPVAGVPFPDAETFRRHPRGFSDINEWRRDNVNKLIEEIKATIDAHKPHVRFGISPFGIYRNQKNWSKGSRTNGLQNYDELFADVLLWDKMGWVDYIMPQLYWEMGHKAADYTELAYWWQKHLTKAHYYIGQSVERTMKVNELHPKLVIAHDTSHGVAMWPADEIFKDFKDIVRQLRDVYWSHPALTPSYEGISLGAHRPEPIQSVWIEEDRDGRYLKWRTPLYQGGAATRYYVVYAYDRSRKDTNGASPEDIVAITQHPFYKLPVLNGKTKVSYFVTQVNRYNAESPMSKRVKAVI